MRCELTLIDNRVRISLIADNPADNVVLQLAEWDKPAWSYDRDYGYMTAAVNLRIETESMAPSVPEATK